MRLLRTIRLDPSDTFVFPSAAPSGDWAISGGFVFSDVEPATLAGKELAAFRGGFLGIPSLGWSTLAQVVEVDEAGRSAAIDLTAHCLLERFGAPDMAAARAAAAEEIDFAASLCDHPLDTLVAVHRSSEGDAIRETFRILQPRSGSERWHAFSFDLAVEEELPGTLDLDALARRARE